MQGQATRLASIFALALALPVGTAFAQTATLPTTNTSAVPTYESVGLYWQSPGGTAGCEVKYRKSGETAWMPGLAMWYDARDGQCRGSLVNLAPGTWYQVEFNLPGQAATRGQAFKTWADQLPVASTVPVNSANGTTLNITQGGSASGYVVYEGRGAVLDGQNVAQYNVTVNASYVILRGLTLKGAKQDAIRISPNVKDVVIEDNDISGWGRTRDGKWGTDMDSGIRAVCSSPTLERVTIQRNRIHDPRYGANSWSDGHPAGPQAIAISYCGGHFVIRHNEIYSATNRFNDAIGGEDNYTTTGFPNRDSDIYGNRISMAWDDGIEAEGGNKNVRIWGNYLDRTGTGIATTITSIGPAYVFRNVWNRNQFYERATSDADERQAFFKSGSDSSLGHGRRYVFHNTMLQATQSGSSYPLGGGAGMSGTGSNQPVSNTVSKNNIYHLYKSGSPFYQVASSSSFERDMFNGTASVAVVNGISAAPTYAAGNGWQSEAGGMYQLASGTAGYDQGVRIPNFNDAFLGAGPDVGAAEAGSAAMLFGLAAGIGAGSANILNDAGLFAAQQYRDFLWREGAASEISFWAGQINSGVLTRGQVVESFFNSPEFQGTVSPVARLYFAYFLRIPDYAGLQYWINYRKGGHSLDEISNAFAASAEFQGRYGALSNAQFVTLVYNNVLGRAPDSSGLAYWTSLLDSGDRTRGQVMLGFSESAEYRAVLSNKVYVTMMYVGMLRRSPDESGFNYWVDYRDSGRSGLALIEGFLGSTEYRARFGL